MLRQCAFGRTSLPVRNCPQFVGGLPECERKNANEDRRQSGDCGAVVVQKFSDMPGTDKRNVISGAIFAIGVVGLVAYLAVRRNKRRFPSRDQQCAPAQQEHNPRTHPCSLPPSEKSPAGEGGAQQLAN